MKRYTAQEMRLVADNVCSDFTFSRVNLGSTRRPVYLEVKPYEVAHMLQHAADAMDEATNLREENERLKAALEREHSHAETASEYEYAIQEKVNGEWCICARGNYLYRGYYSLEKARESLHRLCEQVSGVERRIVCCPIEWEVME